MALDLESHLITSGRQLDLTKKLLDQPSFQPLGSVNTGGYRFFLSSVIEDTTKKEGEEKRNQAVGYVVKDDSELVLPRVFWRSITSGGWRVAPFGNGYTYSKGFGVHYTQETKIVEELNESLEAIEQRGHITEYPGDVIFDFFQYRGSLAEPSYGGKPPWLTYQDETTVFNEHGVLSPLTYFPPGSYRGTDWDKGTNVTAWLAKFDFGKPEIAGFVPDFTRPPQRTRTAHHTLLGEIQAEEFPGQFFDRPIRWVMAQDVVGRTWVDRIAFTDVPINSYGICSEILDSGALTNKPLERLRTVTALREGDEYVPFGDRYADITPLLATMAPIRDYKNLRAQRG